MKQSFELILFDMDGTLYPNNEDCRATYKEVALRLIEEHSSVDRSEAKKLLAKHRKAFQAVVPGRATTTLVLLHNYPDISFAEFSQLVNELHPVERVLARNETSIAAVKKVVSAFETVLYTMNNEQTAQRVLDTIGMNELFPLEKRYTLDTWANLPVSREERLAHVKPGLKGFTKILDDLKIAPERVLMVGDSLTSDIKPAQELKMGTFHVKASKDLQELPAWLGL